MGYPRPRPQHLAAKLLKIRLDLKLSQPQLAKRLGVERYNDVSKWERNVNEPALTTLLAYARLAGISVESLIDDQINFQQK